MQTEEAERGTCKHGYQHCAVCMARMRREDEFREWVRGLAPKLPTGCYARTIWCLGEDNVVEGIRLGAVHMLTGREAYERTPYGLMGADRHVYVGAWSRAIVRLALRLAVYREQLLVEFMQLRDIVPASIRRELLGWTPDFMPAISHDKLRSLLVEEGGANVV